MAILYQSRVFSTLLKVERTDRHKTRTTLAYRTGLVLSFPVLVWFVIIVVGTDHGRFLTKVGRTRII